LDDYSPMTLTLNSYAGGANAYLELKLKDIIHPNMTGTDYITRYWTLNSGDMSAIDYDVSYIYTTTDITGTEANLVTVRWDGSGFIGYNATNTVTNTLSSSTGITDIPLNHDFTGGSGSILPLHLISFDATYEGEGVYVDWITLSEVNMERFEIERSADGKQFYRIGKHKAAGLSSIRLDYRFIDPNPLNGLSYYRLRMLEFDGSFHHSPIVSVYINDHELLGREVIIYPNPLIANTVLKIKLGESIMKGSNLTINLFNMRGQEVLKQEISTIYGKSEITLETSNLSSGVYLLQIKNEQLNMRERVIITENKATNDQSDAGF
ncbi:MAG: T9SS type A sorting domain-containing protein, partial [Bacteroidetes bacterium]|nr:T9SS type A sorting domain-containing protein [Bacteroidota bacterium]